LLPWSCSPCLCCRPSLQSMPTSSLRSRHSRGKLARNMLGEQLRCCFHWNWACIRRTYNISWLLAICYGECHGVQSKLYLSNCGPEMLILFGYVSCCIYDSLMLPIFLQWLPCYYNPLVFCFLFFCETIHWYSVTDRISVCSRIVTELSNSYSYVSLR
jgi:hypothetical protein